jgi:oligopeptide transport system substrate-binding protein
MKKIAILILITLLAFSACEKQKSDGSGYMLNGYLTANPDNLDPAAAGNNAAENIICNIYKSLGEVSTANSATSFTLTENYWNNGERVTSADYAFGLERMGFTHGENGNVIKIIDENTLELSENLANIKHIIYPCNEKFFGESKGRYGLDDENVLSNGDFYVTKWFYDPYGKDNILNIARNKYNSEIEKTYPTKIYYKIVNSDGSDYYVSDKPSHPNMLHEEYKVGTLGLVFNFENESLKKALALSINRNDEVDETISAHGIIPDTVTVLGKSYREIINEKSVSAYDAAAAKSLYESVPDTLPKNFKILANVNDITSSELLRFTKYWNELFGITVSFDLLGDAEYTSKLESWNFEIAVCKLTLDENNSETYLRQIKDKIGTNIAVDVYFNQLSQKKNLSECVEIYGEIEKEFSDNGIFCPIKWKTMYLEHTKETKDIEYRAYNNTVYFKNAKYFED